MDCKTECAARTFLRIFILAVQGVLYGLFLSAIGVVSIPFLPFVICVARWKMASKMMKWWNRLFYTPVWFLSGCVIGIVTPFGLLFKSILDVKEVARVEWLNRWMYGNPKKPNGSPLKPKTEEDKERVGMAITEGVIDDYNEEAKMYGQGIV